MVGFVQDSDRLPFQSPLRISHSSTPQKIVPNGRTSQDGCVKASQVTQDSKNKESLDALAAELVPSQSLGALAVEGDSRQGVCEWTITEEDSVQGIKLGSDTEMRI